MTRYIDVDALKIDIACVYGSNPKYLNWLNNAPTVDAVPVIRCKDCKYFSTDFNERNHCNRFMDAFSPWAESRYSPQADDYCSRAERKEE